MTPVQKIALAIALLGFLAGAGTQLTDIFAPFGSIAPLIVKEIVTISGFISGGLGIYLSFVTGTANQIQAVQAMPGVDKIVVNEKAGAALATLAVDPANNKIQTTPQAQQAVARTAATAAL